MNDPSGKTSFDLPPEPDITINGVRLEHGQAMALRVALQSFLMDTAEPDSLGDDEHGRAMRKAYLDRGMEINHLMGLKR